MSFFEMQNDGIAARFSHASGRLEMLVNSATGETRAFRDRGWRIAAVSGVISRDDCAVSGVNACGSTLTVRLEHPAGVITERWKLVDGAPFVQLELDFFPVAPLELLSWEIARLEFAEHGELHRYSYMEYKLFERMPACLTRGLKREEGTNPSQLWFDRSERGSFIYGMAACFDVSECGGERLKLAIRPNLRLDAEETFTTEAAFFGVCGRDGRDRGEAAQEWQHAVDRGVFPKDYFAGSGVLEYMGEESALPPDLPAPPEEIASRPLPSESRAMLELSSAVLGPPRFEFVALACGWHSDMEQGEYTPESCRRDCRALEVMAEAGLDGLTDSHPWSGETARMNQLREPEEYAIGELPRRVLDQAERLGLIVGHWASMTGTHHWKDYNAPFRADDKPEWGRVVETAPDAPESVRWYSDVAGNCLGAPGFMPWLETLCLTAMRQGNYQSWVMDGDFWGTGAYFHSTVPARCGAEDHKHLKGDSNYLCQRSLQGLVDAVRREFPHALILQCRPIQDLGVWALKGTDFCFTLIECGSGSSNLLAGNAVRTSSRIRVQQHFIPHWMDSSLLFPSHADKETHPAWPRKDIDYLILSAISSSPKVLMYLPTAHPEDFGRAERRELRRWLDWGRENQEYLMERFDFPAWPSADAPDGSAHLVEGVGLVFWFNPADRACQAEFTLDAEGCGYAYPDGCAVHIRQEFPAGAEGVKKYRAGDKVVWTLPPRQAVVLRLLP